MEKFFITCNIFYYSLIMHKMQCCRGRTPMWDKKYILQRWKTTNKNWICSGNWIQPTCQKYSIHVNNLFMLGCISFTLDLLKVSHAVPTEIAAEILTGWGFLVGVVGCKTVPASFQGALVLLLLPFLAKSCPLVVRVRPLFALILCCGAHSFPGSH